MRVAPASRPARQLDDELHQAFRDHGIADTAVKLVGIRSYFRDTPGENPEHDGCRYNDAMLVVSPTVYRAFNANTDPSRLTRGVARLVANQVYQYQVGTHNRTKPVERQYEALVQAGPVTITRHRGGRDRGYFGINIHRGGRHGTSSAGCQTIYQPQWAEFIALVKDQLDEHGQRTIPYLLLDANPGRVVASADARPPRRLPPGSHGLGARNGPRVRFGPAADARYLPGGRLEGIAPRSVSCQRTPSDRTGHTTVDLDPPIEFVWLGKQYRYPLSEYPRWAPIFRQRLLDETRLLGQELQGHYEIAIQYLEADGSFAAFTVDLIRRAKSRLTGTTSPQAQDYDRLTRELDDVGGRLRAGTADDYPLLRRTGLELDRIRRDARRISTAIFGEIQARIETAEDTVTVLQETEDLSVWVWDQYVQVRTIGNPKQRLIEQCGVVFVRAAARAIGTGLASPAENAVREALREAFASLRRDLPPKVQGFLASFIRKGFDDPRHPAPWEELAVQLVSLQLWFAWFTIDFFAFDAPDLKRKGRDPADAYLDKLASALPAKLVGSLGSVAGAGISRSALEAGRKRVLGKVADALETVISSGATEFVRVMQKADQQGVSFWHVLAEDAGGICYRMIRDLGIKLAEGPLQEHMQRRIAADRLRDRAWDVDSPEFWRALILSVHVRLGPVTRSPALPAPTAPLSSPSSAGGAGDRQGMDETESRREIAARVRPTVEGAATESPARRPDRSQRQAAGGSPPARRRRITPAPMVRWQPDGGVMIRSMVRRSTGRRKGYEREMLLPGIRLGLEGMERAHSQGQGTGHESRYGIRYAPTEVNQRLQRLGIEQHIRDFESQRAADVALRLTTVTYGHEAPHGKILKEIQYQLHAVRNGRSYLLYEASIEVDLDRRTRITADKVLDWEPFLRPLPTRPRRH